MPSRSNSPARTKRPVSVSARAEIAWWAPSGIRHRVSGVRISIISLKGGLNAPRPLQGALPAPPLLREPLRLLRLRHGGGSERGSPAHRRVRGGPVPAGAPRGGARGSWAPVETVYLGGGTPSLRGAFARSADAAVHAVDARCASTPEVECTMEANPESLDGRLVARRVGARGEPPVARACRASTTRCCGLLGRAHTAADALRRRGTAAQHAVRQRERRCT